MKQALTLFLKNTFNTQHYEYFIEDNEIYRIPTNRDSDTSKRSDHTIIGGCFFDETHTYDDDDIFYKNTITFYSSGNKEHNIILNKSNCLASQKLFLAFLENVKLISPYVLQKQKYSLTSEKFKYYNVFLFDNDEKCVTALPVFYLQLKDVMVRHEFTIDKLTDIDTQINFTNRLFKDYYFKDIIDKKVTEMTAEEKNIISIYYSS